MKPIDLINKALKRELRVEEVPAPLNYDVMRDVSEVPPIHDLHCSIMCRMELRLGYHYTYDPNVARQSSAPVVEMSDRRAKAELLRHLYGEINDHAISLHHALDVGDWKEAKRLVQEVYLSSNWRIA